MPNETFASAWDAVCDTPEEAENLRIPHERDHWPDQGRQIDAKRSG